jgi:hypothetical protein
VDADFVSTVGQPTGYVERKVLKRRQRHHQARSMQMIGQECFAGLASHKTVASLCLPRMLLTGRRRTQGERPCWLTSTASANVGWRTRAVKVPRMICAILRHYLDIYIEIREEAYEPVVLWSTPSFARRAWRDLCSATYFSPQWSHPKSFAVTRRIRFRMLSGIIAPLTCKATEYDRFG